MAISVAYIDVPLSLGWHIVSLCSNDGGKYVTPRTIARRPIKQAILNNGKSGAIFFFCRSLGGSEDYKLQWWQKVESENEPLVLESTF